MAVIQPRPTHILYQCAQFGDDRTSCNVIFDVCDSAWATGVPRAPAPPPRAEPKWYQNDRMNLLFQNRDVPIKITWTENT